MFLFLFIFLSFYYFSYFFSLVVDVFGSDGSIALTSHPLADHFVFCFFLLCLFVLGLQLCEPNVSFFFFFFFNNKYSVSTLDKDFALVKSISTPRWILLLIIFRRWFSCRLWWSPIWILAFWSPAAGLIDVCFFFFFSTMFSCPDTSFAVWHCDHLEEEDGHVFTVELRWLEHLWDHRKMFETWVVRATEG